MIFSLLYGRRDIGVVSPMVIAKANIANLILLMKSHDAVGIRKGLDLAMSKTAIMAKEIKYPVIQYRFLIFEKITPRKAPNKASKKTIIVSIQIFTQTSPDKNEPLYQIWIF